MTPKAAMGRRLVVACDNGVRLQLNMQPRKRAGPRPMLCTALQSMSVLESGVIVGQKGAVHRLQGLAVEWGHVRSDQRGMGA